MIEGRWKLTILFHLFEGELLRFSRSGARDPTVSQKMLIQQLRQMEADGIVRRIVQPQVPPKVEYGLTAWGQALCPALDELVRVGCRETEESGEQPLTRTPSSIPQSDDLHRHEPGFARLCRGGIDHGRICSASAQDHSQP